MTAVGSARRDGRTFAVWSLAGVRRPNHGRLSFKRYGGDEAGTPPHEKLMLEGGQTPEMFLVGGGAVREENGKLRILWKSGTFQFGKILKTLANNSDRSTALALRDLRDLGVPLDKATAEVERAIEDQWEFSSRSRASCRLSDGAMDELYAAAEAVHKKFEETFGRIDVVAAYEDNIACLRDCRDFVDFGPWVDFGPKGVASLLRAKGLRQVTENLGPQECMFAGGLFFDSQWMLMQTPEAGYAMGELVTKLSAMTSLGLQTIGMTPHAFIALVAAIPELPRLASLNLSANVFMTTREAGYAMGELIAKLPAIEGLAICASGMTPLALCALVEAVPENCRLKRFYISSNPDLFTENYAVDALLALIMKLPSCSVRFSDCGISSDDEARVNRCLTAVWCEKPEGMQC